MRPLVVDRRPPTLASSAYGGPWSVERPGLEYQHAFDLCAVEVHRAGGPVALFASSPFYARELLKRLNSSQVIFCPVGKWGDEFAGGWLTLSPEVMWDGIVVMRPGSEEVPPPVAAAIWAEPERGDGGPTLKHIRRMLQPTGRLWVITSGRLSHFLPEWRRAEDRPARDPAGWRQALRSLRQSGFAIQARYGFHSPVSILWSYAFRLMERLGRSDLADRCLFQMRAEYVVSGWQALLVPVGVIVAKRRLTADCR